MGESYYTYGDSGVLVNKMNFREKAKAEKIEQIITTYRLQQMMTAKKVLGSFDEEHIRRIHRRLFSDVYAWAGEFRTVDLAKGRTSFLPAAFIDRGLRHLKESVQEKNQKTYAEREAFAEAFAPIYNDLNHIHPFREGNGRMQREFIRQLAWHHGYDMNYTPVQQKKLFEASVDDDENKAAGALVEGLIES
ncbi:Fic/DOC family protein [Marinococcus halophilus]|uniref:Fic/DOC family protein n=1 Tax=Marinococcus halophilus TaxID=1371 RepID=UPI0009A891BE|nr:Fic family protein [Marinococcus halophilus]